MSDSQLRRTPIALSDYLVGAVGSGIFLFVALFFSDTPSRWLLSVIAPSATVDDFGVDVVGLLSAVLVCLAIIGVFVALSESLVARRLARKGVAMFAVLMLCLSSATVFMISDAPEVSSVVYGVVSGAILFLTFATWWGLSHAMRCARERPNG